MDRGEDPDTVRIPHGQEHAAGDPVVGIAGEALAGLARRADPRAAEVVKRRLGNQDADMSVLEAVAELRESGLGDFRTA